VKEKKRKLRKRRYIGCHFKEFIERGNKK